MADTAPEFRARESDMMLAWMHRDASAVKSCMSSDCLIMIGSTPPVLLDRNSFVSAVGDRLICNAFQFHEVTARKHNKMVWFTGHVELDLQIGHEAWSSGFLLTDLWRKTTFGGWKVIERSLAPLDVHERMSAALRSLQMWR